MSSRFEYCDDGEGIPIGLWRNIVKRSITGKRGQEALRELEAALLALPQKRLISGFVRDEGNVCAVGALGLYREMQAGKSLDDALEALPEWADNDFETAEYGRDLGLTETLAWTIAEANDEKFSDMSPEARYDAMLAWVRDRLRQEVAA